MGDIFLGGGSKKVTGINTPFSEAVLCLSQKSPHMSCTTCLSLAKSSVNLPHSPVDTIAHIGLVSLIDYCRFNDKLKETQYPGTKRM